MSTVEVTVDVELVDVVRDASTADVVEALLMEHDLAAIICELKEQSAEFVNEVLGEMDPIELIAAVLNGIGPDKRTTHGWLVEFRERLDKECGGPLGTKAVDDRTRLVNGLRWRFAGNHDYADALKGQKDGWRLPTRHEWECDHAAVRSLDMAGCDELLAWVGGEKQCYGDDDSILMWGHDTGKLEDGAANAEGATFFVREER